MSIDTRKCNATEMSKSFLSLTPSDTVHFCISCKIVRRPTEFSSSTMLIKIFANFIHLIVCCALFGDLCATMSVETAIKKSKENRTQNCEQLPLKVLKRLHGPAFDARYMSINKPLENDDMSLESMDTMDRKRKAEHRPSFYITDDHTLLLSEEPAWNIEWDSFKNPQTEIGIETRRKREILPIGVDENPTNVQQMDTLNRQKRQNHARTEPWRCEKKVKWVYLGPDFHPSHLRTIECTKPKCYYGMFDCKPKQFAVKILQRRRGVCADAASLKVYGFSGKYAEVWEWVEVSVNFCCDCVAPKNYY